MQTDRQTDRQTEKEKKKERHIYVYSERRAFLILTQSSIHRTNQPSCIRHYRILPRMQHHRDDATSVTCTQPYFRAQFQKMCEKIGVDPLASSKGLWGELLGLGDFYYELGVQIIEVCIRTRPHNGGIIGVHELLQRLKSRSKHRAETSVDDVVRSVGKLKRLGSGFGILRVGRQRQIMVVSVPLELGERSSSKIDANRWMDGLID